jgi:hypothetical protein
MIFLNFGNYVKKGLICNFEDLGEKCRKFITEIANILKMHPVSGYLGVLFFQKSPGD